LAKPTAAAAAAAETQQQRWGRTGVSLSSVNVLGCQRKNDSTRLSLDLVSGSSSSDTANFSVPAKCRTYYAWKMGAT
jgi:hypothetical protein